jgi:hypothetical protein
MEKVAIDELKLKDLQGGGRCASKIISKNIRW